MAKWDESEHPRWPAGSPGDVDGRFRPKGGKAVRDLASLSRSTLLKYARERGLALPRGLEDDAIRKAIRSHDSGGGEGWAETVEKRIAAKKAPAKAPEPAGTVRAEGYSAALGRRLRVVADGKGGYIGQRQQHSGAWLDDPSFGTGNTPRDVTSRRPKGQWRMVAPPKASTKPTVGEAFNSRKHPAGTRVVWRPNDGEEPTYGTVGRKGRFTVIDWDAGNQEKIYANTNHEDIRVVSDDERMEATRQRLGIPEPDKAKAVELRRHAGVTRQLGHMRIANNPKGSYHHTRGQQDLKDADQMENEADRLDPPAHLREVAKKTPIKRAAPKRSRVDAADVAEQITTRMPRASEDEIVVALGSYTVAELRRIATQVNLSWPKILLPHGGAFGGGFGAEKKMTPEERRRYIAQNIVRDRSRWSLR